MFYCQLNQGCGLGLDVSVSRPSRDLSKVSSRSRLGHLGKRLVSVSELMSRSWPRSRQFRSRAQVPANHFFYFLQTSRLIRYVSANKLIIL